MKQVTHLSVFGVHIELIFLVAGHLDGFTGNDPQTETVYTANLLRIVGHEDEVTHTKVGKDAGTCAILAQVGSKAECYVSSLPACPCPDPAGCKP